MPKPISTEKKIDWKTKIQEQQESGLSINEWCSQNQITKGSFHYWKIQLFPDAKLARSDFTELPANQNAGVCIEYQGVGIIIDKAFDPATLRSCLAAVRGFQC